MNIYIKSFYYSLPIIIILAIIIFDLVPLSEILFQILHYLYFPGIMIYGFIVIWFRRPLELYPSEMFLSNAIFYYLLIVGILKWRERRKENRIVKS
ncbi:MAG: hypothetical protein C0417_05285 [Chlorobiaceae bacterium]|nr:hypothetical protein [Chlorobiaceae bacterium]